MKPFTQQHSFARNQLQWILVFALIPSLLVAGILGTRLYSVVTNSALQKLQLQAGAAATALQHRLALVESKLDVLGENTMLTMAARNDLSYSRIGHTVVNEFIARNALISAVVVSDVRGHVKESTPWEFKTIEIFLQEILQNQSPSSPHWAMLSVPETGISEKQRLLIGDKIYMVFPRPLSMNLAAVGIQDLDIGYISAIVELKSVMSSTADQLPVGHGLRLHVDEREVFGVHVPEDIDDTITAKVVLPTSLFGKPATIEIIQRRSLLMAPIYSTLLMLFGVIMLIIIGAGWFGFGFTRRMQRPFAQLQRMVNKFERGDYAYRSSGFRYQEFESIRHTLEGMADKLIKQLEELRVISDYKDRIFENISEGLVSPLHASINIINSVLENSREPVTCNQYEKLKAIQYQAEQLIDITNDMVDASNLRSGNISLYLTEINIKELLHSIVSVSEIMQEKKSINFEVCIESTRKTVLCDQERLTQILLNLTSNATRFTESGTIKIAVYDYDEDFLLFSVQDTGVGIQQNRLSTIFDEFSSSKSLKSETPSGTGLGLSITKQLVELLGGSIRVDSTVGKGSVFSFTVPENDHSQITLSHAADFTNQYSEDHAALNLPLQNWGGAPSDINIFVVDGDPINVEIISEILAFDRWQVTGFLTNDQLQEALLTRDAPDLLLIAVDLGNQNGIDICEKVRQRFSKSELPVILLSGSKSVTELVNGFAAGANDFIYKPITKHETIARVNAQLSVKKLARRLESAQDDLQQINSQLEELIRSRTNELETAYANLHNQHENLKSLQNQLVQNEKMSSLGTLVAGVAHEINNPVNYVYVGAANLSSSIEEFEELIMSSISDAADSSVKVAFQEYFTDFHSQLSAISDGSTRIKSIVLDLKTFSRLDEAKAKSACIDESINSTLNIIRGTYKKTVNFHVDLENLPPVTCYPAKLNQVFMNLIVNACQAMVSEVNFANGEEYFVGDLFISARLVNDDVEIIFRDTGPGIPQDALTRVFEPFYTTKPVGEGTGLGLAISYGIIQEHQGEITVAAEIGKGTTFTILLPLHGIKNEGALNTDNDESDSVTEK